MEGSSFDPFLKTGIIFAILSLSGWVPVIKLMLAIQQSGVASSWHMCWRIIEGILAGPVDFLGLILKMIVDISSTFMGSKLVRERGFEGGRNFWKFPSPSYGLCSSILSATEGYWSHKNASYLFRVSMELPFLSVRQVGTLINY